MLVSDAGVDDVAEERPLLHREVGSIGAPADGACRSSPARADVNAGRIDVGHDAGGETLHALGRCGDAAVLPGGAEADAAGEGVVAAVLVGLDQRVVSGERALDQVGDRLAAGRRGHEAVDGRQPVDGAEPVDGRQPVDGAEPVDGRQPVDGAEQPLTELRPLTDESASSWVPVSTSLACSPQPTRPAMAPSATLIWMVRFPNSLILDSPLRRPGRLRESRWLCVARSLGVCVCSQGVGPTRAKEKAVIEPTLPAGVNAPHPADMREAPLGPEPPAVTAGATEAVLQTTVAARQATFADADQPTRR